MLSPTKDTTADFEEMVIQFGYLALFAPAYPVAPLMAFFKNVYEIRADAVKYCIETQRPPWRKCEDIGSWSSCLNFLGFMGVVTNATMVTMVGSALAAEVELRWDEEEGIAEGGIQARLLSPRLW